MRRRLVLFFLFVGAFGAPSAFAACSTPPGSAGDIIYNSTYNQAQFCNGTAWVNMGASGTVTGIGTLTNGDWCNSDGTLINCTTSAISLSTSVTGTLQAAQFPALTGDVTSSAGSLATTIAAGHVTNAMLAGSIAYSKLALTGAILNADLAGSIAYGKLSLTGAILNADLAGSIAASKLVGTDIATVGTITTGTWHGTAIDLAAYVTGTLPVANGGTGAATLTSNGVLYGNGTSAVQITAQGAANTILTANAGAPAWSASPTIGTSVTSPLHIGGTAASSTLTLESTSGTGSSDSIIFKTGSQAEAVRIDTSGKVGINSTSPSTILDIVQNQNAGSAARILNNNGSSGAGAYFLSDNGTNSMRLQQNGTGKNYGASANGEGLLYQTSAGLTLMADNASGIIKFAAGGSSEKVRIDASGNVGIGTTTPATKLQVAGSVLLGDGGETCGATYYGAIRYNSGAFQVCTSAGWGGPVSAASGSTGYVQFNSSGALASDSGFFWDNTNKRLGIGTTSPGTLLDVGNGGGAAGSVSQVQIRAASADTSATRLRVANTSTGGHTWDLGAFGSAVAGVGGFGIGDISAGVWRMGIDTGGGVEIGSSYIFTTGPANGLIVQGNVGIGTAGPGYTLDVNGQTYLRNSVGIQTAPSVSWALNVVPSGGTQHGIGSTSATSGYYGVYTTATVSGAKALAGIASVSGSSAAYFGDGAGNNCQFNYGSTSWSCASDARRKTDIKPIENALGRLALVKGVTFRWKADPSSGEKMGVIAQDVLKAFPDAVSQDAVTAKNPGYYTVTYDALIGPLISGVNELNTRTSTLPTKIEALEKSTAALKADNDNLRRVVDTLKASNENDHAEIEELRRQIHAH